jgi:hypothetical protein
LRKRIAATEKKPTVLFFSLLPSRTLINDALRRPFKIPSLADQQQQLLLHIAMDSETNKKRQFANFFSSLLINQHRSNFSVRHEANVSPASLHSTSFSFSLWCLNCPYLAEVEKRRTETQAASCLPACLPSQHELTAAAMQEKWGEEEGGGGGCHISKLINELILVRHLGRSDSRREEAACFQYARKSIGVTVCSGWPDDQLETVLLNFAMSCGTHSQAHTHWFAVARHRHFQFVVYCPTGNSAFASDTS